MAGNLNESSLSSEEWPSFWYQRQSAMPWEIRIIKVDREDVIEDNSGSVCRLEQGAVKIEYDDLILHFS
jgi:hypothetical protein